MFEREEIQKLGREIRELRRQLRLVQGQLTSDIVGRSVVSGSISTATLTDPVLDNPIVDANLTIRDTNSNEVIINKTVDVAEIDFSASNIKTTGNVTGTSVAGTTITASATLTGTTVTGTTITASATLTGTTVTGTTVTGGTVTSTGAVAAATHLTTAAAALVWGSYSAGGGGAGVDYILSYVDTANDTWWFFNNNTGLNYLGGPDGFNFGSGNLIYNLGGSGNLIIDNGKILPGTDNAVDLGDSTHEFKDLFVDGTAYVDAINFNGTAVSATAAELNYSSGVTSSLQTQINAGTLIGAANSAFIPCSYEHRAEFSHGSTEYGPLATGNVYFIALCPLPTSAHGKSLYVKNVKVALTTASATEYINEIWVRALAYAGSSTVNTDLGDYTSAQLVNKSFTAVDVSGYQSVIIVIKVYSAAGAIRLETPLLECYYA